MNKPANKAELKQLQEEAKDFFKSGVEEKKADPLSPGSDIDKNAQSMGNVKLDPVDPAAE